MGDLKIKYKGFLFLIVLCLASVSAVRADDYRITTGDELELFVWNHPDLARQMTVMMDGSISMPMVGKLPAEGLTVKELEYMVEDELSEYIRQPRVSIIISRHSRWVVSIFGEVRSPSGRRHEYDYHDGLGLLELVAYAGGVTREARLRRCAVLRRTTAGRRERIEVDLRAILNGKSPDFILEMGDVVYVPHTGLSTWNYFLRNIMPSLSFIASLVTMSAILF